MVAIMSQSGHKTYGMKEYIVDTDADIASLHIDDAPGSAALVAENGNIYVLNCQHEWKQQGGGNTGGGESSAELETKIKELEKQQKLLQEQVAQLTAINKLLVNEIEQLKKELEEQKEVIITDESLVIPEEASEIDAQVGEIEFDEYISEVREDGTLVLK